MNRSCKIIKYQNKMLFKAKIKSCTEDKIKSLR